LNSMFSRGMMWSSFLGVVGLCVVEIAFATGSGISDLSIGLRFGKSVGTSEIEFSMKFADCPLKNWKVSSLKCPVGGGIVGAGRSQVEKSCRRLHGGNGFETTLLTQNIRRDATTVAELDNVSAGISAPPHVQMGFSLIVAVRYRVPSSEALELPASIVIKPRKRTTPLALPAPLIDDGLDSEPFKPVSRRRPFD